MNGQKFEDNFHQRNYVDFLLSPTLHIQGVPEVTADRAMILGSPCTCLDHFCAWVEEVVVPIFKNENNMSKFPQCVSDGKHSISNLFLSLSLSLDRQIDVLRLKSESEREREKVRVCEREREKERKRERERARESE